MAGLKKSGGARGTKILSVLFLWSGIGVVLFLTLSSSSPLNGGGGGESVVDRQELSFGGVNDIAHSGGAKAASKGEGDAFDFSYDRAKWERNRPRIIVLAGPHKTATSSIQWFFASIAGSTVRLTNKTSDASKTYKPHPSIADWVWPLGVEEEELDSSVGGGFQRLSTPKYYMPFVALIMGNMGKVSGVKTFFLQATQEDLDKVLEYHRALFRRPWEEGKNIVFGSELLDRLVHDLVDNSKKSNYGEEMHVSPTSSKNIDSLLDIFPWNDNSTTRTTASVGGYVPPLRLEDIEVQINYRTPRIDHLISVWHETGNGKTMRQWLPERSGPHVHVINALALALQFVRKGIRTSIVDMAGVSEQQSETNEMDSEPVFGGVQGVIACEIIRMGENRDGLCDEHSRLHLPRSGTKQHRISKDQVHVNSRKDETTKNLTSEQMDEINRVLEEYDCGVWKHLKKYQAKGTLRVLHPSKNIFENCSPNDSAIRDISWKSAMDEVLEIVSRDNGIPKELPGRL